MCLYLEFSWSVYSRILTEYGEIRIFSPNARRYRPEELQIRTLSTQWFTFTIHYREWILTSIELGFWVRSHHIINSSTFSLTYFTVTSCHISIIKHNIWFQPGTQLAQRRCNNVVTTSLLTLLQGYDTVENERCADVGFQRCDNVAFRRYQDVATTLLQRRHNF